jgi:D-alanine-D-alanine ligase
VERNIGRRKFEVRKVIIGRDGKWMLGGDKERILLPNFGDGHLRFPSGKAAEKIDVAFPLVHGTTGEDGCLQGMLELAGIPYVGSGVLGSALGMDKIIQKKVLRACGLPVVDFIGFTDEDWRSNRQAIVSRCRKMRGPWFVKPSGQGSSIGISKVHGHDELASAIGAAFRFDQRVLVEKAVRRPREFEIAVVGGSHPLVSRPAEIKAANEFYDYDAKYQNSATTVDMPADIPLKLLNKMRRLSWKAFTELAVDGLCRVDFLYSPGDNFLFINEINTIPGLTESSAFPKLCEVDGLAGDDLIERLIKTALSRSKSRLNLRTMVKR